MAQTEQLEGFDQCCVVQFSCGFWRARKKLKKEQIAKIVAQNPSAAEWLTGSKSLVDPQEIKKINKIYNAVQSAYLNPNLSESPCLVHPIPGIKTLPLALVKKCDDKMKEFEQEFWAVSEKFFAKYEELKEAAKSNLELDGLYNLFDYPQNLRTKFYFTWRFLSMGTPDAVMQLDPEIYEREAAKLRATYEQVRQESIDALRFCFHDMVAHIVKQFTTTDGKRKQFQNSTINKFYEFFEYFKDRNVFGDDDLNKIVTKAQGILKGRDPDLIRESDSLQKLIKKDMKPLEKKLEKLTSKPRRSLDI